MHCKDVALCETDSELTVDGIGKLMKNWVAYVRAGFLVLKNGDDYSVISLDEKEDQSLFSKVIAYTIISLPENTIYLEIPDFDVVNIPAMAKLQMLHPNKTVVVKGMFSHISFVSSMEPLRLRVIDSIPPEPMKLGVLVDKALESGFVEHPVVAENIIINMADEIQNVNSEAIMFPCGVSGLKSEKPYYFLDQHPVLKHKPALIGCHLSKRIFTSLYNYEPEFLNVCPSDRYIDDGVKTISKCCKVKSGCVIEGNHAKVPWGATIPEVVDAINNLFS